MTSFAIGIPTLNRNDLLTPALSKYVVDFPRIKIHIIDNGSQDIISPTPSVKIHVMPENMGVATSWNFLCEQIFRDHDVAFILNDDIYWGASSTYSVLRFIEDTFIEQGAGFVHCEKTWCVFAITKDTFKKVGNFDGNFFPAYFEDNDYAYRMKLAGIRVLSSPFLFPVIYRNSMTLQRDKTVNDNFMKNHDYYIAKWGGRAGLEKFLTPFNK
jgi:GT2 family glycosyltransferase